MNYKRILKYALIWLVTITIFVIIFSRIRLSDVFAAIKQADARLLSIGLMVSFFGHTFLSPARYREILRLLGCSLSFFESIIIWVGNLPIKGVIPFKAGVLSIVAYLKKVHNLSFRKGVSSVLFGYVASFIALFIFIVIGWFAYYLNPQQKIYFFLLLSALSFFVIVLFRINSLRRLFKGVLIRIVGEDGLEVSSKENWPKSAGLILLYSLGFEGAKLLTAFFIFKALNIEVGLAFFLLFVPMTFFVASLPITICGLGTRESTFLLLFASVAAPQKLLAASLLISFIVRFAPILLGLFFVKPFLNRLLTIDVAKNYS